jgi:hypothetical protein
MCVCACVFSNISKIGSQGFELRGKLGYSGDPVPRDLMISIGQESKENFINIAEWYL